MAQWLSYLFWIQLHWVQFPAFLQFFVGKNGDIAEVNQLRLLEVSGQWFENLVSTCLVLASGKLVLQKNFYQLVSCFPR